MIENRTVPIALGGSSLPIVIDLSEIRPQQEVKIRAVISQIPKNVKLTFQNDISEIILNTTSPK